jgi:hypothetical protein
MRKNDSREVTGNPRERTLSLIRSVQEVRRVLLLSLRRQPERHALIGIPASLGRPIKSALGGSNKPRSGLVPIGAVVCWEKE